MYHQATFTGIARGTPEDLAGYGDRVLMLSWPYNEEERKDPWDARCLDYWTGGTLVHIGEWRAKGRRAESATRSALALPLTSDIFPRGTVSDNPFGVTTSRSFQERVECEFEMVRWVKLPNFPFARDDLTVWERAL